MILVKEVKTRKERKQFLDFPYSMYKGVPYYVPPLYMDEKKIFSDKNAYSDTCESVFFNAYEDGVMVGRIQGIIQRASNKKTGEKRVRFTRFDCHDNLPAATALFKAVEDWAVSKGCDTVCGPLGYSDLEREGLLIEGFDWENTFEEQYNFPYYASLIEAQGFKKEVDWIEHRIFKPEKNEKITKIKNLILEKYGFTLKIEKSINTFVKKYKDELFYVLDEGYKELYGTVPMTDKVKKQIIGQFKLILKPDLVGVVLDKENHVVGFGLCFPAIGDALKGGNGKLTPKTIYRLLKIINNPKRLDLGLIAVLPKYKNLGLNSIVLDGFINLFHEKDIEYCETNLMLENNYAIQAQWKYFPTIQHKRRRSYVKKISKDEA